MDTTYLIYLVGLVAPVLVTVLVGVLVSFHLIRRRHPIAAILASLVIGPITVLLLLVALDLWINLSIQEMDRVHEPDRDLFAETDAILFGVAVLFGAIDAMIGSVVAYCSSLLYLHIRASRSARLQRSRPSAH